MYLLPVVGLKLLSDYMAIIPEDGTLHIPEKVPQRFILYISCRASQNNTKEPSL
jgi:hypothetical protein